MTSSCRSLDSRCALQGGLGGPLLIARYGRPCAAAHAPPAPSSAVCSAVRVRVNALRARTRAEVRQLCASDTGRMSSSGCTASAASYAVSSDSRLLFDDAAAWAVGVAGGVPGAGGRPASAGGALLPAPPFDTGACRSPSAGTSAWRAMGAREHSYGVRACTYVTPSPH